MIGQCEIDKLLFKAKMCSASISIDYVNAVRYGYENKSKELFNVLVFLKGAIRIFGDYNLSENVFIENSVLNKFGKKALLSTKNPLSLKSKSQKILLSEEKLNCLSEDELCKLSEKITSICSIC